MARGGTRPGAGRPATGQNTGILTVRLPLDIIETIKRRAANNGMAVNAYLQELMAHEYRPRHSRISHRDRKDGRVSNVPFV